MSRAVRVLCLTVLLALAIPSPVFAQQAAAVPMLPANCQQVPLVDPDTQKVTETYLICMPADAAWNGSLVVFAHGYVMPYPPTDSPTLPLDQIATPDGLTTLPAMINAMGYGFAMTSYTKNGLAVKEGAQNTIDLVSYVRGMKAPAVIQQVFVVGASEGGLITTQLIENHPDLFNGGVAVCGPVGDFRKQIDFWGDFRAVFDYYFPTVLPPSAVSIPEDPLMIDWVKGPTASTYQQAVIAAMMGNVPKVFDWFTVTGATVDPNDPYNTAGATALGILSYNVLATNEAEIELGLQPFDNTTRNNINWQYTGSSNDTALNAGVARYTASGDVPTALLPYQTTGQLQVPLITMHNTLDPIVPFWHEGLYKAKVVASNSMQNYADLTIPTYGHCNFKTGQMFYSFARLLYEVNHQPIPMAVVQAVLQDPTAIADFTALNAVFDVTALRTYLPSVQNGQ